MSKKRIAIITSVPFTIKVFLVEQIKALSEIYEVTVLTSDIKFEGEESLESIFNGTINIITIPIVRQISITDDLKTAFKLFLLFREHRFDVIHSITPKAGLLAMSAGFMARVKKRIHTFTGQVWATKTPPFRWLLMLLDIFTAKLATNILVDSKSQRDFIVANKIVSYEKSKVLANGSISGVNTTRFSPNESIRKKIREDIKVNDSTILILYLGRLHEDKGVYDLLDAYKTIVRKHKDVLLLFVGPDDSGIIDIIKNFDDSIADKIEFISYTKTPEDYMRAADIFCLPSYREGFGSVVIEAASCGVPSVVSRIYGLTDAVVNDETGLIVDVGDGTSLSIALLSLIEDSSLRTRFSKNAISRAKSLFDSEILTCELLNYYEYELND